MKKFGVLILAIIVLGVILYLTFIIAVLEIAVGAILLILAIAVLWWLWSKIKDTLD